MQNWQKMRTDEKLRTRFLLREQVNEAIRLFFKQQAFHEVETPLLLRHAGTEPYLHHLITQVEDNLGQKQTAYLATSPEYAMKKLLAAGLGNIFQLGKAFRNRESFGGLHNPEFSLLEFYHLGVDYFALMQDFEKLLLFLCKQLGRDPQNFIYQGQRLDLQPPYPRFSVAELFAKYLALDSEELFDLKALTRKALALQYDLRHFHPPSPAIAWEELYQQLFLNEIEPQLRILAQPVIVYDYPSSQSALAQPTRQDPRFAERFEVYCAGMELGNAFGELTDPVLQKNNLQQDLLLAENLGKKTSSVDQSLLEALQIGLPICSGMAVGVDRLLMLLADVANIDEVLFFPASELFASSS